MKTFGFPFTIFSTCSAVRHFDCREAQTSSRTVKGHRRLICFGMILITLPCLSLGQTIYWSGASSGGNLASRQAWNTGSNWQGGSVPSTSQIAGFGSGTINQLTADLASTAQSVLGVSFEATGTQAFTITGTGTLTIGSSGISNTSSSSGTQTISVPLTLGSNGAAFTQSSNTASLLISGTLSLGSNSLLLTGSGSAAATISGIISSTTGGITKTGSGTWTLSGANTYGGATTVSAGNLTVNSSGKLGTGDLSVASGATLNLNSASVTSSVGNLSGAGTISFGAAHTLSIAQTGAQTFSGSITGSGAVTLASGSSAALTLSGGTYSYSGGTTISGGILKVNGSLSSSSNAVTINSGGTLAGTGSVAGAVTLNNGGFIAPGDNSLSTLSLASLTWNGGTSALNIGLGSSNSSDKVAITGAFTKGTGSTFTFDFGNTGTAGSTYTVATWGSTTFFSGGDFTYTNLPSNLSGSFNFVGNSLTFTTVSAIPEPSTYAALAGAGALGLAIYRRRQAREASKVAVTASV